MLTSVSEISDTVIPNGILIISPEMHPLALKNVLNSG